MADKQLSLFDEPKQISDKKKDEKIKAKDIVSEKTEFDETAPLYGKVCVFTGKFSKPHGELMQMVADVGGINGDNVTLKTDYLFLSDNADERTHKSKKLKRAEELKQEGHKIAIASETDFWNLINSFEIDDTNYVKNDTELKKRLLSIVKKVCADQSVDLKYIEINELISGGISLYIKEPMNLKSTCRVYAIRRVETEKTKRYEVETLMKRLPDITVPDDAQQLVNKINFPLESPNFFPFLETVFDYVLRNFKPSQRFGCCSKYTECSDAKTCLHRELFYAKACFYKDNLEAGRIFYGQNRNVD